MNKKIYIYIFLSFISSHFDNESPSRKRKKKREKKERKRKKKGKEKKKGGLQFDAAPFNFATRSYNYVTSAIHTESR